MDHATSYHLDLLPNAILRVRVAIYMLSMYILLGVLVGFLTRIK